VRFDVCPIVGCPVGDIAITGSMTDIRLSGGLNDYTGELRLAIVVRVTDRYNGPTEGEPATMSDTEIGVPVACAATQDTTIGSTCSVSTTANAVIPGALVSGKRSIWEVGQVQVQDGGPDGVASTNDNSVFARQGLFVP
jgi:hypothetical protein